MRVLVVDNYDSFTWNLVHDLQELGAAVDVRLNDEVDVVAAASGPYDAVVVSPGPGRPEGAGRTLELIDAVAGRRPLLGVCLGHQAIALHWGGSIVRAPSLMHGKTSLVEHDGGGLYEGLPRPFRAMRYHSLVVEPERLPDELRVDAWTTEGVVMGLRHRTLPVAGVQFHPESFMTEAGKRIVANFLRSVEDHAAGRTWAA